MSVLHDECSLWSLIICQCLIPYTCACHNILESFSQQLREFIEGISDWINIHVFKNEKIFINLQCITFYIAYITQRDAYYCYQGTTSWVVKCCQISQSTVLKRIGKPLFRSTTSVSFNWYPCWPNLVVFMRMSAGKFSNQRVCNMQRPMMSLRTWSLPCRCKLFSDHSFESTEVIQNIFSTTLKSL